MIPYLEHCVYYVYYNNRFGQPTYTKCERLRELKAFLLSKCKRMDFNSTRSILHSELLVIDLRRVYNDYLDDFIPSYDVKDFFIHNITVYDEYDRLINHNLLILEMISIIRKFWYTNPKDRTKTTKFMDSNKPEWRRYMSNEELHIHHGLDHRGHIRRITPDVISKNVMAGRSQFEIEVDKKKIVYRKSPVPRTRYRKYSFREYHSYRGLLREISTYNLRPKRHVELEEIYKWGSFHQNHDCKSWKNYNKDLKSWGTPCRIEKTMGFKINKTKKRTMLNCEIEEPKPFFDCSDLFNLG